MDNSVERNLFDVDEANRIKQQERRPQDALSFMADGESRPVPRRATGSDQVIQIQEGLTYQRNTPNFFSLELCLTICLWIVSLPLGLALKSPVFALVCFMGSYVWLVSESLQADTAKQIKTIVDVENAVDYILKIKQKVPRIRWECSCFHEKQELYWDTETYTTSEVAYNSTGGSEMVQVSKTRPVQKVRTVQIETHREHRYLSYTDFEDISGNVTDEILQFRIVKLDCSKEWYVGSEAMKESYNQQKAEFIQRNQHRDALFSWWESLEIHEYRDGLISLSSPEDRPLLLGEQQYFIASILGLSWFYQMWLEHISVSAHFCFKKRVL